MSTTSTANSAPGRGPLQRTPRPTLPALTVALLLLLAGCGSDGSDEPEAGLGQSGVTSTDTAAGDGGVTGGDVVEVGWVVALGEERVLADLLALGIRPVASTANVIVDGGFVGLDAFDTEGIEPLPATEPNLELLDTLDPDLIVANEFVVDELGRDILEARATLVVVPDGDAATQVQALGDAFGRREQADALVADLEAAIQDGREALADLPEDQRTVSVMTVYSGPTLAAWVDRPVDTPTTLLDLGFTLSPDPGDVRGLAGGATRGRAYISNEQIGLFSAPTIVMLQTGHVEGEDDAIAEVQDSPLWSALPAVREGRVITVDRLGYPGIAGHIRLVDDLVEEFGDLT